MAIDRVDIEVRPGPALRTSLDVLDLAVELLELIPPWHAQQRRELADRTHTLNEMALRLLREQRGE